MRAGIRITCAATLSFLAACSAGGGAASSLPALVPSADKPATDAEAARFLRQATFGPSRADIAVLRAGGFTGWLEWQRALPVTRERPVLEARASAGHAVTQADRMETWWKHALEAPDALRMRVAFALSEILVVSDDSTALQFDPVGAAEYYDVLARNALGDFRTLLEEVTLSPQMGKYLSLLRSQKSDPERHIRPDENYAREVMQLFTIGLHELNPDGSYALDAEGRRVATFDQALVETYARAFTGWTWGDADHWDAHAEGWRPMRAWQAYHDRDPKTLIDGRVLAANRTAEEDLDAALDSLVRHRNVGPFLGRQLIQRLVTSNPSPEYVRRVAHAFDDDGRGTRGNLHAVVKAILLDPEARHGHETRPDTFGKAAEPIVRQAALWRAFHARSASGAYRVLRPELDYAQAPLRSPSVFNFYSPFHQPPGEMTAAGLYAPELEIATNNALTTTTNAFHALVFEGHLEPGDGEEHRVRLDLADLLPLAGDPARLVDEIALRLVAGALSGATRDVLVDYVASLGLDDGGATRAREALFLLATSPEGALQR